MGLLNPSGKGSCQINASANAWVANNLIFKEEIGGHMAHYVTHVTHGCDEIKIVRVTNGFFIYVNSDAYVAKTMKEVIKILTKLEENV